MVEERKTRGGKHNREIIFLQQQQTRLPWPPSGYSTCRKRRKERQETDFFSCVSGDVLQNGRKGEETRRKWTCHPLVFLPLTATKAVSRRLCRHRSIQGCFLLLRPFTTFATDFVLLSLFSIEKSSERLDS